MRRRLFAATTASAVLVTGLVGCSAQSVSPETCVSPLQPGLLSSGVELSGFDGTTPEITIASGSDSLNAQRSVVQRGDSGVAMTGGEVVTANLTVFDATTGETLVPTQKRFLQALPEEFLGDLDELLTSNSADRLQYTDIVMAGLVCAAPGDVLAITTTAGQSASSGLGEQAAVMIVEVLGAQGAAASGSSRTLPAGFPALTQDETGRPGIVLPPLDAPTQLQVALSIEGRGAILTAEDYALGQVLTVSWDGRVLQNTWESSLVELGSESQPGVFALRQELTGLPIGSRVVILDPQSGNPQVHVVDIIAAG